MPSPALLQAISINDTPSDSQFGNIDKPWGGRFSQSGISVPSTLSVSTAIFYPGGCSSYTLIANVQAARNLSINMRLYHPVTLVELTDAVGLNVPISILASFGPGLVSITFGPDGVAAQAQMMASFPFALQFQDNLGIGTTALSFVLYGFAVMNRGVPFE